MQIQYCDSCGYRIPERDLAEGRTASVEGKLLCEKCRPAKASDKPSKSSNATIPPAGRSAVSRDSSSNIQPVRFAESSAPARALPAQKPPPKSNTALLGLVAGLAAAVLVVGFLALSSPKPPTEPERTAATPPSAPPAPVAPVKSPPALPGIPVADPAAQPPQPDPAAEEAVEKEASDAFDAVTRFEGLAEEDYAGRAARLGEFIAKYGGSMVSVRARKMQGELKARAAGTVATPVAPAADPAVPPGPAADKPAATAVYLKQDTSTRGAWKGVYGADGYYLPNYLDTKIVMRTKDLSLDILKKPDYLHELGRSVPITFRAQTADYERDSAMQDPAGNDRHLSLDMNNMNIPIVYQLRFNDDKHHQVALYFTTGVSKRTQHVVVQDLATRVQIDKQTCDSDKFRGGFYMLWDVSGSVLIKIEHTGNTQAVCSGIFFDPPPGDQTPATPAQPGPAPENPAEPQTSGLLAELRKDIEPLLKAARFSDALPAFDAKAGAPRYASVKELAARERADIAGLADMKQKAWAELRKMTGKTVTLAPGGRKLSGTVKADPKREDISLRMTAGAEISMTMEQLELADVDALAPHAAGDARKDDLRLRGLIAVLMGDAASARSYFNGAKNAGLCEADDYLKRLDDAELQDAESNARRAWTRAESLYQGKQWKDAQAAYEDFEKRWSNTKWGAEHGAAAKDRIKEAAAAQIPYRAGLVGAYFKGRDLAADTLVLTRVDEKVDFAWGLGSPAKEVPNDSFSARWTGFIKIVRPGTYTLAVYVDDGTRLTIGGKKVIDQWTFHSPTRFAGTIELQAGLHELNLEYFEATNGAACQLRWALKDSFAEEIVPASVLFHEPKQEPVRK